jgi:phenylacetate-coenzyme A ligase PaaK-like adenylate-forming protein
MWYKTLKIIHSDKENVKNLQQQRLSHLLQHAVANSEFYREYYKGLDLDKCSLQDLPIMKKAAMMDNYDRIVTDKRLKLHKIQSWLKDKSNDGKFYLGEYSPFLTSGSSGTNALITYHRKAVDVIQASLFSVYNFQKRRSILAYILTMAGCILGKKPRIATMIVPRGNIEQLFKRVSALHSLFVNLRAFSLSDPLERIVEGLNNFQPDQLISPPSSIALFAHEQIMGRLKLSFSHPLALLAGNGEVLTPHTKELAAKAWNMNVQDTYGSMECYLMATSCNVYDNLHIMSHLCIIEIVDRKYKPVTPGQYGEKILLTNLFNFTQPIIRYEIEDVTGYADYSCKCGSPFPILLPVRGRTTDFFYFKKPQGGYDSVPPGVLFVSLYYLAELRQYQIVQTARNELTIIYVPHKNALGIEPKLKKTVTEALIQRGLETYVKLRFKRVKVIPRDERSGKYKSVISLGVPADLDAS